MKESKIVHQVIQEQKEFLIRDLNKPIFNSKLLRVMGKLVIYYLNKKKNNMNRNRKNKIAKKKNT